MRVSASILFVAALLLDTGYSASVSTPFRIARDFALEAAAFAKTKGHGHVGRPGPRPPHSPPQGSAKLSYPGFKNLDYLFVL